MRARPIQIQGDLALIPLTKGKSAIIDVSDVPMVEGANWYVGWGGYAVRSAQGSDGKQIKIALHRVLTNAAEHLFVDHVNGDKLDNRRCNLREATNSQNQMNSRKQIGRTSAYKGVSWNKSAGKWQAQIKRDKRSIYLGIFNDEVEAHAAYCTAAAELHGKYARFASPTPTDTGGR